MNRTRLSADKRPGQCFLIFNGLFITGAFLVNNQPEGLIFVVAVSGFLLASLANLHLLEFDGENLYILENKGDTIVPLGNIRRIVSANRRVSRQNVWEITWEDEFHVASTTPFLPIFKPGVWETFIQLVEEQAPGVEIENSGR